MFSNVEPAASDAVAGSEVRVYVWDSVGEDWDEISTKPFTFAPTSTTDQLPRGAAVLINAKTVDADVNGKKYIGGLTETSNTDGLVVAAEVARQVLLATDWLEVETGAESGAEFDAGIWSPLQQTLYDLTGTFTIPAIWAYQRRRKRGVGI